MLHVRLASGYGEHEHVRLSSHASANDNLGRPGILLPGRPDSDTTLECRVEGVERYQSVVTATTH